MLRMEYRVLSVVSATVIYEVFEWTYFPILQVFLTSLIEVVVFIYLALLEINPFNSRFHYNPDS